MYSRFWSVLWLLASNCSAASPATVHRGMLMHAHVDAGADAASHTATTATTATSVQPDASDNAGRLLLPVPPALPPVAGTKADLPFASCEVGKFCPIQQRGEEDCGTLSLTHDDKPQRLPGNVLILFDQSLSMNDAWGSTGMSKLQAAQSAIANAVAGLQDSLNVAALFFPTQSCSARRPSPPGGAVAPLTSNQGSSGQIAFAPGALFLEQWAQHWQSGPRASFGTPLQEAFDRADAALAATQLKGALAVIAVTDGQPTCVPTGNSSAAPAVRAQSWLATRMIKTYVLGLPGASGVQLLNDIAAHGGTMQYLLPDDPAALQAQIEQVVQDTILTTFQSCSIDLDPPARKPERLELLVVEASTGQKHHLAQAVDAGSGWSVAASGDHVDLVGQLCVDAQSGRFRAITFEYPCDPKVPPPAKMQSPQ